MHTILVLVGCCGCGKDYISKLLMSAYPQFMMISTSKILQGGNSDGSMVNNDLMVHLRLENELDKKRVFDLEYSGEFIFNGAGRNRIQMSSLIGMLSGNRSLTDSTFFVKLNITSQESYRRMVNRYHENILARTLRKEEEGEYDVVLGRFRSRISEWQKTRKGIFESMDLNLSGTASKVINVNVVRSVADVLIDLVQQLGLPEGPAIDVLVNSGLLETRLNSVGSEHSAAAVPVILNAQ